jgi:hypothetical protein
LTNSRPVGYGSGDLRDLRQVTEFGESAMRCRRALIGLVWLAIGCQSSSKAPYADNPLLMSREPLKQTAAASKTTATPTVAQSMPIVPPSTVIRTTPAQTTSIKSTSTTPTANEDVKQVVATSAVVPAPAPVEPVMPPPSAPLPSPPAPLPPPTAIPAPVAATTERFAHAADYSWLVGEIDVHYRGHKEMRFCPMSEENAIGGKVRLVDDPRLADLKAGTLVRIEGELVRDDPTAVGGEYPRYHIRNIQIIDKPAK